MKKKLLGNRFLELKAAMLLCLGLAAIGLNTGYVDSVWYDRGTVGIHTVLVALIAVFAALILASELGRVLASARKRHIVRRPFLLLNLILLGSMIALWISSVFAPVAVHRNSGPMSEQILFLIPHRIVFASVDYPADPDGLTASALRPSGIFTEELQSGEYASEFMWKWLGFQSYTGPSPQLLLLHADGKVLSFVCTARITVIPIWVLVASFYFVPLFQLIRFLRRRSRLRYGVCVNCSYDLRAHQSGDKCPECGTQIPAKKPVVLPGKVWNPP